ncbi:hypothetical protein [Leptothoe spongobia]|uniref:Uncharacterized protein n=1 Tax=Leptothoe spongobia TAU-MAC 1115 TaxID=1967444 RepID=A0A947DIL8_9CYAN|nr:hypothetical protein [Leptothoe spongobia]MBT9317731.1 hypothetical protein [Leptothoe spongobia TAU-MAC 1115]
MSNTTASSVMKLPELKEKVRYTWDILNEWDGAILQPENFAKEMKTFGDRRYKKTWVNALCKFEAMLAYASCLDSWMLLTSTFAFRPERWDYEYRHQIFNEFLMYPKAVEIIKTGLEDIFHKDFDVQEREKADEFFRLLEEREGSAGAIGFSTRFTEQFAGSRTAA